MPETKEAVKPKAKSKEKSVPTSRMSDETIAEIRKLRAMKDEAGKPIHTHGALGQKFGVGAGTISQIVRNRTYHDPNYKPVNDGA